MKQLNRVIQYSEIPSPKSEAGIHPIALTDQTMKQRYEKILSKMKTEGYSTLVIYEDLEHGSNFEYLTGFLTRFEEALLILHDDGNVFYVLGNENLKLSAHTRLEGEVVHCPYFSLPNQPMNDAVSMEEILDESLFKQDGKVGLVGWKLFTGSADRASKQFDVPYYIVETIKKSVDSKKLENATALFIGDEGARTVNNSNEIAHYEFGAALASAQMLKTLEMVEVGKTEMELGQQLNGFGQPNSVVTIAATGERFEQANLYPAYKKVALGDKISLTVGYKGGLQSRSAFAAKGPADLPDEYQDYLDKVVFPYFNAITTWLETVHIGMQGKEVYELIETELPKEQYGWHLNPGHYVADEEWMASPIYSNSEVVLKSGMMFQVDIIPSIPKMPGTSAEGGIVLADAPLKEDIKRDYPELWSRMQERRRYVTEVLGIELHEDILMLGNATPYLRPFLLEKAKAVNILKKLK